MSRTRNSFGKSRVPWGNALKHQTARNQRSENRRKLALVKKSLENYDNIVFPTYHKLDDEWNYN